VRIIACPLLVAGERDGLTGPADVPRTSVPAM
jgi:hypothetical protein